MNIPQYTYYIGQRERLLAAVMLAQGSITDERELAGATVTVSAGSKQYTVEPRENDTPRAYRKRLQQLDAAVKAIFMQDGLLGEMCVNLCGKQYVVEPTPEQQERQEYQILKKLMKMAERDEKAAAKKYK